MYIWELPDWPHFRWNADLLAQPLAVAHLKQGRLLGRLERLGFPLQIEAELQATTEEAVKNAEIEGEILNRESVRSSVARRLGVPDAATGPLDRRAEGIVEMTLDATRNCAAPLSYERLFAWQAALFPTGRSGLRTIKLGAWRDDARGPMQVVSGPIGRERIHFQAVPAERIAAEIQRFIAWFDAPPVIDGILHAAIAHLWFVTIHPFDDGNGRIARVLADMSLARSEGSPQRFYSLSGQIRRDRPSYYGSLERTQKGDLDITARLLWFVECFSKAIDEAEQTCAGVLHKAEFWHRHALTTLNERQRTMLNRLLDNFEGKLTARKWAAIVRCSMPTAQRDIKELVDRGILARNEGGSKNTSYRVAA
ncbi:MAG TPA: Fic family protein [Acetobacteraceae bacterium]